MSIDPHVHRPLGPRGHVDLVDPAGGGGRGMAEEVKGRVAVIGGDVQVGVTDPETQRV